MTMMMSTMNTNAIAREAGLRSDLFARLAGQAIAHPLEEPGKGGYGLGNHDAHEHQDRDVAGTHREAAGDDLELREERVHGRHAGNGERRDTKAHARDRVLLYDAAKLGQHTRAERKGERTGDQEEQRLGESVVKDVAHGAIKGQLAAKDRKAQTKEHVGELGDRGEGQQTLHILCGRYIRKPKSMVTMASIMATQPTISGTSPAETSARANTHTPTLTIEAPCR